MLNGIPIPKNIDRQPLIENVDRIIEAQHHIDAVTNTVHSTIRAAGGGSQLGRLFDRWYMLDRDGVY